MDIIKEACNLEGQPLSKKNVQQIVNSYVDGPTPVSYTHLDVYKRQG